MPAGQPFTLLCQKLATGRAHERADLHLHTTSSDGLYSPAQVVDLAFRSGLCAIAITDHDTLDGVLPARQATRHSLEVIAGVEITTEFRSAELHLLAYFVDPDNEALQDALRQLRADRVSRFHTMVKRLRALGLQLGDEDLPDTTASATLGRRHLADALVKTGRAATVREAFQRFLGDRGRVTEPKRCLPTAEAIALVREAGGVAAWAHPTYDCTRARLTELKQLGMQAVEVAFPGARPGRSRELRALAGAVGLAATAGSDCHGPGPAQRSVGACTISSAELELLRSQAAPCSQTV